MAEVLIVGGGVVGMGLGMMLARDAHTVTIVERDAQPTPKDPEEAWDKWERRGVNQFRLPHLFMARYREILEEDLPDVAAAIGRDGAVRGNPVLGAPESITGGPRPGDARYEILSGRRAVVERAVASVAEGTPGLEVRRGVAVAGLLGGPEATGGVPHVTGVRTTDGDEVWADLVIDCGGRRSALPDWLEALGARRPEDEVDDSGFIYFGRHFRSRDGQLPVALGPGLQPYGSISALMIPCDNDTWAVTLVARSGDRALLGLNDVARWERTVRALPTVAHWLDGDPIEDRIVTIAKIEDRHRDHHPAASRWPPGWWRSPTPGRAPIPRWGGGRPSGCCTHRHCATRSAGPVPTTRPRLAKRSRPPPRPRSSPGTRPRCPSTATGWRRCPPLPRGPPMTRATLRTR
jgi:2-polyprenyl-6-methoxyphenol hydroxylase-like FAD-dependent oxidoreductase